MPWNGAGVWSPPGANYPAVSLTVISSTNRNAVDADIATGLSNCITKDGQQTVTANIPMGGFKVTNLGLGTSATDAASVTNVNARSMCEFRLTLSTGLAVPVADVIGATTIYCTPYKGNCIALFDGTNWNRRTSAEFSLALGTLTSGRPYDIFCYDNAGVPTLEFLAWTSDTNRATSLVLQDGVLVKSGALTRRYLGTFYTTATTTTEDSYANRYLWNYYNRVHHPMRVSPTGAWTYNNATIRQANATATNQINFVIGYPEDSITASLRMMYSNTVAAVVASSGIGMDSITAYSSDSIVGVVTAPAAAANIYVVATATYCVVGVVGKHYLAMLEAGSATGTNTFTPVITYQAGGLVADILG